MRSSYPVLVVTSLRLPWPSKFVADCRAFEAHVEGSLTALEDAYLQWAGEHGGQPVKKSLRTVRLRKAAFAIPTPFLARNSKRIFWPGVILAYPPSSPRRLARKASRICMPGDTEVGRE